MKCRFLGPIAIAGSFLAAGRAYAPHSFFFVETKDDKGVVGWAFEGAACTI